MTSKRHCVCHMATALIFIPTSSPNRVHTDMHTRHSGSPSHIPAHLREELLYIHLKISKA